MRLLGETFNHCPGITSVDLGYILLQCLATTVVAKPW